MTSTRPGTAIMRTLFTTNYLLKAKSNYLFNCYNRNLLKLIKRKINTLHGSPLNDDGYVQEQSNQDKRNQNKKSLEDIYSNVLKHLDEVGTKQSELESKVDLLCKKNDDFVKDNKYMTEEVVERKSYAKNLELLIFILLDFVVSHREVNNNENINDIKQSENSDNVSNPAGSLCTEVVKHPKSSLTALAKFITDEEKAGFLSGLFHNSNNSVIRTLLDKTLEKYNLKLEDLIISLGRKKEDINNINNVNNINNINIQNANKTQSIELARINLLESASTNLSSPTSLTSTQPKDEDKQHSLLCTKRRRADAIFKPNDSLMPMSNRHKENMFEEINSLTPCLISYPNMSPPRLKRGESINFPDNNDNPHNLFNSGKNINSNVYHPSDHFFTLDLGFKSNVNEPQTN